MTQMISDFKPTLTFLRERDRTMIHDAVVEVLGEIGMKVQHDETLDLMRRAGCSVDDGTVKVPQEALTRALQSAPTAIEVFDRTGSPAMDLGDRRSYFGPGSDLLYTQEPGGRDRHRSVLEDVKRAARVAEALPNIDFIMSLATPSDVPPRRSYVLSVQAMMESSTKPIVCTADTCLDLGAMWEMAVAVRGGEEPLVARPYIIHYAEPVSPLTHPHGSLDKLLLCADRRIPVIYSPAPIAGSTAPMTIAGHVVQGLAECFFGLVVHQARSEGAPFIMGMGPAVLDMKTVECSYNAPEYYMSYACAIEMSHRYDLPSWGYAGHSDAQLPDGQATLEAGMITFLSAMAGANLCHDVGYLDFGRMGSLEMLVIGDEIIDQVRRVARGVPVDAEHLATDVIRNVGPGGHFLGEPHTRKHVRTTQWRPGLFSRLGYDAWRGEGANDLPARARDRLNQILESREPDPLPASIRAALQECVDRVP